MLQRSLPTFTQLRRAASPRSLRKSSVPLCPPSTAPDHCPRGPCLVGFWVVSQMRSRGPLGGAGSGRMTQEAEGPALALTILLGPNQSASESVTEPRYDPCYLGSKAQAHFQQPHQKPSQEIVVHPVTMTLELGFLSLPSPTSSNTSSVTFKFHLIPVSLVVSMSDFVDSACSFSRYLF